MAISQTEFDKANNISFKIGGGNLAMSSTMKHQDKLIKNYFTKDIHFKDKLRQYRNEMNQKYPDPSKKLLSEASDSGLKGAPSKNAAKKGAKDAKAASKSPTPN